MTDTQNITAKTLVKQPLRYTWSQYAWPLTAMLSLSMCGLHFPLGYILLLVVLVNRFKRNRYDFLIVSMLLVGNFGLIGEDTFFGLKMYDVALALSLVGLMVYKLRGPSRKAAVAWGLYVAGLLLLARFSDETMGVQFRIIRAWMPFIAFVLWLMLFSGRQFDMQAFFRRLGLFTFVMCCFYIMDGYVIGGHIMLPRTFTWGGVPSTFYNPALDGFLSFPRKYPTGLFLLLVFIYPMARYYKLSALQWMVIVGALFTSRTFTIITALAVTYVVSMPDFKRAARWLLVVPLMFVAAYFVDSMLPPLRENQSALRVKSSMDQIINLSVAEDDEDMAEAGSGRIGQAIPKLELLNSYNKEWTGLGFLHPQLTTNTKYIIDNEYYVDAEKSEEVATGIEVHLLQVYLNIGILGLLLHLGFYFYTWWLVRGMQYSRFYLSTLVALLMAGMGGFAGLHDFAGITIAATVFGTVLLANRKNNLSLRQS